MTPPRKRSPGRISRPCSEQAVAPDRIGRAILVLRGHKVLLDADLAQLYGVETRTLIQAVKRNIERFAADFMFQLTLEEALSSRSQFVILNGPTPKRGKNIKYLPHAFTEQGVAMLSSVLRSPRAVQVNIEIMRAFVRLRRMFQHNGELARKLAHLEKKCDAQFRTVFDALRELLTPPAKAKRLIGFRR